MSSTPGITVDIYELGIQGYLLGNKKTNINIVKLCFVEELRFFSNTG